MAARKPSKNQRTWLALAPAMVVPSLGALCYFILFTGSELGQTIFTLTKVFGVAWPILATLLIIRNPARIIQTGPGTPPLHDRIKKHFQSIPLGLISGFVISAGIFAVAWLTPLENVILAAAPAISQKINDLGFANNFLLLALGISLLNSAMEEYYWRWFVYGNLRHIMWLPAAHLLAAFTFSAHHLIVTSQFFPFHIALLACAGVFVGGIIWSALYQLQKSIFGVWISHIIVDLAIFTIAYQLIS